MKRIVQGFGIVSCFTVCFACGSGAPSTSAQPSQEASIHRTVVHLKADGTSDVREYWVSPAQSQAEQEVRNARMAQGASSTPAQGAAANLPTVETFTEDSSCAGADLWVYDGYSGSCPPQDGQYMNEACFYGSGTGQLSNYSRCTFYSCTLQGCGCHGWGTWQDAVRAYWPGTEDGYFYAGTSDGYPLEETFSHTQSCTVAGTYAQQAVSLTFTD